MRNPKDINEDGIYLLRAGRLNTVWIMSTRLDPSSKEKIHLWRDVQDWVGNVYSPEDLNAYKVVGRIHPSNSPSIESFVD